MGGVRDDGPARPGTDKQNISYVLKSMLAGGVAGCVAKSVIAPLDRVKILFQTGQPHFTQYRGARSQTYNAQLTCVSLAGSFIGVFRALGAIVQRDGIAACFRGHSATLARIFPYAAIQYMSYEQIKHVRNPSCFSVD